MPASPAFLERLARVVPDLARGYGTPFHVYDAAGILASHRAIVSAFGDWPARQHFAVKALPNPAVLKLLAEAGSGLDCSSPAELLLADAAGVTGRDIVFTSNNTTRAEYEMALARGCLVTFDDVAHMDRAQRLPGTVAFRVAPHTGGASSALMGAAGASKFGVPRGRLAEAYARARARGARSFGIHGMTCANELDLARALQAARDLVATALEVEREAGITFDYVNVGGGLGIPYRPGEAPFDLAGWAAGLVGLLREAFGGRQVRLVTELGRIVTGPHGVLVTTVVNRLDKGRAIVGLDASMSALMRPGFYENAWHHVTLPFAGKERPRVLADVVGSLCENVDRFAVAREMPDPREGEIVYIHDTGAHGAAMGFTYNGRLRPAELLLMPDDGVLEIRRAETFSDYVATVVEGGRPLEFTRHAAE
jgi:diaminopimelate decarboxylase/decarboxylase